MVIVVIVVVVVIVMIVVVVQAAPTAMDAAAKAATMTDTMATVTVVAMDAAAMDHVLVHLISYLRSQMVDCYVLRFCIFDPRGLIVEFCAYSGPTFVRKKPFTSCKRNCMLICMLGPPAASAVAETIAAKPITSEHVAA